MTFIIGKGRRACQVYPERHSSTGQQNALLQFGASSPVSSPISLVSSLPLSAQLPSGAGTLAVALNDLGESYIRVGYKVSVLNNSIDTPADFQICPAVQFNGVGPQYWVVNGSVVQFSIMPGSIGEYSGFSWFAVPQINVGQSASVFIVYSTSSDDLVIAGSDSIAVPGGTWLEAFEYDGAFISTIPGSSLQEIV
jgi:hypothetical protein